MGPPTTMTKVLFHTDVMFWSKLSIYGKKKESMYEIMVLIETSHLKRGEQSPSQGNTSRSLP